MNNSCFLFQNAKGMSKDDVHVPLSTEKKGAKERDPNTIPKTAALVNGKYVTYTRSQMLQKDRLFYNRI